jgi:hypothetical protein
MVLVVLEHPFCLREFLHLEVSNGEIHKFYVVHYHWIRLYRPYIDQVLWSNKLQRLETFLLGKSHSKK